MKKHSTAFLVLLIIGLALSACNLPSQSGSPTPDLFATLAATAGVPLNLTGVPTSVAIPASSETPLPNATIPPAGDSTALPPAATSTPVPTISSGGQTGGSPAQSCTYLATFIADVTVPDDSHFDPGQSFTKTWRVRNDGTCTWGSGYPLNALAFYNGARMEAPYQLPISGSVGPGQMLDITANMVAPSTPGMYTSEWMFTLNGSYFGLGANGSATLYTRIIVGTTPIPTKPPLVSTRINLPAGATTTSLEGAIAANGTRYYVLTAAKNQLLMASISSASSGLILRILDASTMQALATVDGPAIQAVLPHNGDYYIQIQDGGTGADFNLGVTLPARISFAPGGITAIVDGKIVNRFPTTYLLRAMEGQDMTVEVTAPSGTVALTIYGLSDGQPLVRSASQVTTWNGTLPATQDYVIMVVPSVDSTTFTLTTTVQ